MHSSRMRTVRCSGHRGGCLPRGFCLGVSAQGVSARGGGGGCIPACTEQRGCLPSACWDTHLHSAQEFLTDEIYFFKLFLKSYIGDIPGQLNLQVHKVQFFYHLVVFECPHHLTLSAPLKLHSFSSKMIIRRSLLPSKILGAKSSNEPPEVKVASENFRLRFTFRFFLIC